MKQINSTNKGDYTMYKTETARTRTTLNRYKDNLKVDYHNVYSYETKVAEIDHVKREITPFQWYSVTTTKHINYVGSKYGYKVNKERYTK